MKIIIFFLLITGTASAQTVTVSAMNTAISKAIAAQAKIQANTDALQDARATKTEARLNDTIFFDKKFLPVIGKTVTFSLDSLAKYFKVPAPVVDLTAVNSAIGLLNGRIGKVETGVADGVIRLNSLEGWRTNAINDLKNINAAILKIPTKAASTSISTTTTTTTTTLQ